MTTPYGGVGVAASPWVQPGVPPQNPVATASIGLGITSMVLVTPAVLATLYPQALCGLLCLGLPFIVMALLSGGGAIITGFRGMSRAAGLEGEGYGSALGGTICGVLAILLALVPLFRLFERL